MVSGPPTSRRTSTRSPGPTSNLALDGERDAARYRLYFGRLSRLHPPLLGHADRHYEARPLDHARDKRLGLEFAGAYRSDPRTPAVPSARNGGLAAYPEAVHLIVFQAAPEPEVRCYRIEEPFNSVDSSSDQRRSFILEEITVDWPRKEWGVPGLEGAERALRPRRPFEPDPGNAGGGIS